MDAQPKQLGFSFSFRGWRRKARWAATKKTERRSPFRKTKAQLIDVKRAASGDKSED